VSFVRFSCVSFTENTKKLFIESYGRAMNFSDSGCFHPIQMDAKHQKTLKKFSSSSQYLFHSDKEQTVRKLSGKNVVKRINPK
jgi:tRNA-2-methylthio-N6-dimethylallyladenosine synthase